MDFDPPNYKEEDKFNHKVFEVEDCATQNIIQYFGECINFIKENDKILVHCMAGASRSATIVIAYIMWEQKMSSQDALDFVSKKRSIICPNEGFIDQLKIFEKLLKDNNYDWDKIDFKSIKWEVEIND